jgi:hypothetical protein
LDKTICAVVLFTDAPSCPFPGLMSHRDNEQLGLQSTTLLASQENIFQ